MKEKIVLILVFSAVVFYSAAQGEKYKQGVKVPHPVCYASGKVEKARIPPPKDFLLKSGENATANIQVDYLGFTEEARTAFAYAVSIWASIIESDMPIRMKAVWSGSLDQNVLGSCGPETYYSNFKDAPFRDRYYPVAIAEKIANKELNGASRYDMEANFNKNIDWYYGTDLNCPDTLYDFVSVVLHEIGHGLGFTGFFFVEDDVGGYGYFKYGDATSFDLLVQKGITGTQLVDTSFYENVSNQMKRALESLSLYANSPIATKRNNGANPRLYAPYSFDGGSSVYHLNDATYDDSDNALMTHAVGKAEAIHDPGPITRGIMDDIGWRNIFIRFDPPKDMEVMGPFDFDVTFESDYSIDEDALFVIYSTDGFNSHVDTLLLEDQGNTGVYHATLTPKTGTDSISYYVHAGDVMGRIKTSPSLAPKEIHSVSFGPDNEDPVIAHTPIPYFLLMGQSMSITVEASDNLGIDTVYVAYSINGEQQTPFGLTNDYSDTYSGEFTVSYENLKDGDEISYSIFALDASSAKNNTKLPTGKAAFSYKVETIFDPVQSYSNNFNQNTVDFVVSDFDVYTANGFENGALQSLHPYLSPGVDNEEFEYFTFLKRPIILKESGTMTFDEVVLVEPGELQSKYGDDDFWDYVIVEGSKDYGEKWLPISDGYDSGSKVLWKSKYNENIVDQNSLTEGSSNMYFNREIDLLENGNFAENDTVLIRFRLYSDPYAAGWGWAIDNLIIQQVLAADVKTLPQRDIMVYPNPFNTNFIVNISSVDKLTDIQIEVYDMFGRKLYSAVKQDVFGEIKESIDLANLNSGIFLIKVSENGKTILSKKLIKN